MIYLGGTEVTLHDQNVVVYNSKNTIKQIR